MRLLNAKDLTLEEFPEGKNPAYLILSHTWATNPKEEVLYKDIDQNLDFTHKAAWRKKVQRFCALAVSAGYEWVWIDTCCIDKSSSYEITEAINSMFRWYQSAEFCVAYLTDVRGALSGKPKWFTRGWTLQELLAPKEVHFYDHGWNPIGSRTALSESICRLTRIPSAALSENGVGSFTIEQRCQWMNGRETTREEDMVYSLLGLLGLSMPANYGERFENAKRRLVRTIEDSKNRSTPSYLDGLTLGVQRISPSAGYGSYGVQTNLYPSTTAKYAYATQSTSDPRYNTGPQQVGRNWRWWIPAEGISGEVIQADITRYLGPEAVVRPGGGIEENQVLHHLVTA